MRQNPLDDRRVFNARDHFDPPTLAPGALRFVRADGRTIPRGGYRRQDFEDCEADASSPSAEGFFAAATPIAEVREPAAIYRLNG